MYLASDVTKDIARDVTRNVARRRGVIDSPKLSGCPRAATATFPSKTCISTNTTA